jgi:uncharacterized protein YjiS (DUF1127 family)
MGLDRSQPMRTPALINLPSAALATLPRLPALPRVLMRAALRARMWWRERATLAAIERLDAATLRDIGMSRWQVREHFRAERDRILQREAAWRSLC